MKAIDDVECLENDPFLQTANVVLAEEELRVEMLRQRLQMILKG